MDVKRPFSTERMVWMNMMALETLLKARSIAALGKVGIGNGILIVLFKFSGSVIAPYKALPGLPRFKGSAWEIKMPVAMGVYTAMFWIVINMSASLATLI